MEVLEVAFPTLCCRHPLFTWDQEQLEIMIKAQSRARTVITAKWADVRSELDAFAIVGQI